MTNGPALAGAALAVSASAAHFILPAPPNAQLYNVKHRFLVGATLVAGAGVAATVLTKDKTYLAVAIGVIVLSGVAYYIALKLEENKL